MSFTVRWRISNSEHIPPQHNTDICFYAFQMLLTDSAARLTFKAWPICSLRLYCEAAAGNTVFVMAFGANG